MAAKQSLFVLRTPEKNLMSFRQRNVTYAVAFEKWSVAKEAQKYVQETTQMYLRNHNPVNITPVIRESLLHYGHSTDISDVYADQHAELLVSKKININKMMCELDTIPLNTFSSYPMIHHLGIVFLKDIIDESSTTLVFDGETIDPILHNDLFREGLKYKNEES
jgi:hypothetical protein